MEQNSPRLWRDGNLLLMHRDVELPDRCVKTNQPAHGKRLRTVMYWHPQYLYLLLLANVFVYFVVSRYCRRKAVVYCGVTEQVLKKRIDGIWLQWITLLTGLGLVALLIVGITIRASAFTDGPLIIFLILAPLVLLITSVLIGRTMVNVVELKHIQDEYFWITGVCSSYLATLPEWDSQA